MKRLTPYQQEMQRQTAAYEALQFTRRLYPWRVPKQRPKPVTNPAFVREKIA